MNPTQNIPSRLSERSFRLYEDSIAQAVKAFPQVVTLYPRGNLNTFVARLRDAMLSLERYRWGTKVDVDAFIKCRNNYMVVVQKDDCVLIGTLTTIREHLNLGREAVAGPTPSSPPEHLVKSRLELNCICSLAAKRLLACDLKIIQRFDYDQAKLITELEDNYDICVTKNNNGTFTIS